MEWYRIRYMLGNQYGETLIHAHNEKEAGILAGIQIRASRKSRAKFEVVSVGKESEDNNNLMKQLEKFKVKRT